MKNFKYLIVHIGRREGENRKRRGRQNKRRKNTDGGKKEIKEGREVRRDHMSIICLNCSFSALKTQF